MPLQLKPKKTGRINREVESAVLSAECDYRRGSLQVSTKPLPVLSLKNAVITHFLRTIRGKNRVLSTASSIFRRPMHTVGVVPTRLNQPKAEQVTDKLKQDHDRKGRFVPD